MTQSAVQAGSGQTLYSVIRYVPSVLREEFVNIGVIVVSVAQNNCVIKAVSSFGSGSRVMLLPGADGEFVQHASLGLETTLRRIGAEEWTEQRFHDVTAAYAANNIRLTVPRPAAIADPVALVVSLFSQLVEDERLLHPQT